MKMTIQKQKKRLKRRKNKIKQLNMRRNTPFHNKEKKAKERRTKHITDWLKKHNDK